MCSSGCCGPSELQAQPSNLAHQCSRHTSHSRCVITRYICGRPCCETGFCCDFGACVCRNCFVKAGKQQLAEGFCSEHIWTHPGFKGKLAQHLGLSSFTYSTRCKMEDFLCRPLCHCCQREQKMVLIQGTFGPNTFCTLAAFVHHLSYAGHFSFISVFLATIPQ